MPAARGIKRRNCNEQDHWSCSVCSHGVRRITRIRPGLSLLPARQRLRLPGLVSFHKLPAVPGYGLRDIFVLWHESPICVRIATARPITLPNTVIETPATRLPYDEGFTCNPRNPIAST